MIRRRDCQKEQPDSQDINQPKNQYLTQDNETNSNQDITDNFYDVRNKYDSQGTNEALRNKYEENETLDYRDHNMKTPREMRKNIQDIRENNYYSNQQNSRKEKRDQQDVEMTSVIQVNNSVE